MPNNQVVLIRVDANERIGVGHLMRCIALAYAMESLGLQIVFATNKEGSVVLSQRENSRFRVNVTPDFASIDEELQWLECLAKQQRVNAIVLDGYHFTESYRLFLHSLQGILIVLDDCNDSGLLYADVVINPVNRATELHYQASAPGAKCLLGQNYTLLRPEFCQRYEEGYLQRTECLITMGGADVAGLTLPLLNAVTQFAPQVRPVSVVTGSAYRPVNQVRELVVSSLEDICHYHNVLDMSQRYVRAKLAISAAGGSIFELAALAVPSIIVVVADNQLKAAVEQQEKGWCKLVDARDSFDIDRVIETLNQLWNSTEDRVMMHQRAQCSAIIDGAHNAAREIIAVMNQRLVVR